MYIWINASRAARKPVWAGKEPKSQFERVLGKLGIELILAHSPQAKGRIERLFETLQDRLVKALREAGASSMEKANGVLKRFLHTYNQRFMVKAEQGTGQLLCRGASREILTVCLRSNTLER